MSIQDYYDKDLYAELGVSQKASASEIKKAYRKLARELHPDANPDNKKAEERFKAVSEAHDILSDADKRKEYDEVRQLAASGAFRGFPGGAGGGFSSGGAAGFDLSDLLNSAGSSGGIGDVLGGLFNRGGGTRRARKGADIETDVRIGFEQAVDGATVPLRLSTRVDCGTCHGTGSAPGSAPSPCSMCDGTGLVTRNQGNFAFSEPCRACHGTGSIVTDPCPSCHGARTVTTAKSITTRIPPGVKDGQRIRLPGKGDSGINGGPSGDLYLVVHVDPHPLFGREGDDLTLTVPVSFPDLVLGTTVTVPTLHSTVTLKIPAGTDSGRKFRVRGAGVKHSSKNGDLIITVKVAVPQRVSDAGADALRAFANSDDSDPREQITAAVDARSRT